MTLHKPEIRLEMPLSTRTVISLYCYVSKHVHIGLQYYIFVLVVANSV